MASPLNTPNSLSSISPPSLSSLQKRTPSIMLNACLPGTPPDHYFNWSYCVRSMNPRTFRISCSPYRRTNFGLEQLPNVNVRGSTAECPENYICMNGPRTPQGPPSDWYIEPRPYWTPTAYCVFAGDYLVLSKNALGATVPGTVTLGLPSGNGESGHNGHDGAVEAVLTDMGGPGGKCVNASSVAMHAQANDLFGAVRSWRDVLNGEEACEMCASVGFTNVSEQATRVDVEVNLGEGVSSALLFLVSVFS
ncbi:hypothetical protein MMC12_005744 [Toensbergia leucococca]|nr:hypothetical protein [Toensbergia leucococca]